MFCLCSQPLYHAFFSNSIQHFLHFSTYSCLRYFWATCWKWCPSKSTSIIQVKCVRNIKISKVPRLIPVFGRRLHKRMQGSWERFTLVSPSRCSFKLHVKTSGNFGAIYRRDIAEGSDMFETWCKVCDMALKSPVAGLRVRFEVADVCEKNSSEVPQKLRRK